MHYRFDDSPATLATRQERIDALRVGASVLRARWPNVKAEAIVLIGPNRVQALAAFDWPGVVRVTVRWNGGLIAQSKPGKPFEYDPKAL
jgi:hypothetical protein